MKINTFQFPSRSLRFILALIFSLTSFAGWISAPESATAQSNGVVLVGAGDIGSCSTNKDGATAKLLNYIGGTVFTLGDNVYPNGKINEFKNCYGPTWGRHKQRTRPAVGNHEYKTKGAAGYYTYFGKAATPLQPNCTRNCQGYYSYNLGAWHIIVLNSEISMKAGSAQERWLRADLKAHPKACTLAYWHKPRFSSGKHGNYTETQPLWEALYDYGADVVLNGHEHVYEHFAPQNPGGKADPQGMRQFIVGTGGADLYGFGKIKPNSQVRHNKSWGVLKLSLYPTAYKWRFIPIAGSNFSDSGTARCVQKGKAPSNLIFGDSFESGNLKAWSSTRSDGNDLSVSQGAAMAGSRGLQARIDDGSSIYVTDDSPAREPRYQARFSFDPNSINMASGDRHYIFRGYAGNSTLAFLVELRFRQGRYQLRTAVRNGSSGWKSSEWFPVPDAPHRIRIAWRAATAAGASNGRLALWINGNRKAVLAGVNNGAQKIDQVRLGAIAGVDSGTRGTYYFDTFKSWR